MTNDIKHAPRNISTRHMPVSGRFSPLNEGPGVDLGYKNMMLNQNGSVMREDQIQQLRERQGYCTTCTGAPVQLFAIRKAKLNPLWNSKEPLTVPEESYKGVCLKCYPNFDKKAGGFDRTSTRTTLTASDPSLRCSLEGSLRVTRRRDSRLSGSLLEQMTESFNTRDSPTMPGRHMQQQTDSFHATKHVEPPARPMISEDQRVDLLNLSRRDSVPIPLTVRTSPTTEHSASPHNILHVQNKPTKQQSSEAMERVRKAYERTFSQISMDDISAITLEFERGNSIRGLTQTGSHESCESNMESDCRDSLLDEFSVPDFSAGTGDGIKTKSHSKTKGKDHHSQEEHHAAHAEGGNPPRLSSPLPGPQRPVDKQRKPKGMRSSPNHGVDNFHGQDVAWSKPHKPKPKKASGKAKKKNLVSSNYAAAVESSISPLSGSPAKLTRAEQRSTEPPLLANPTLIPDYGFHSQNDNTFSYSLEERMAGMPVFEDISSLASPSLAGGATQTSDEKTPESDGQQSGVSLNSKVEEVASLINDVMAAQNPEFLADLLGNTMRSHREREDIQALCLRTIWDLSKYNSENKECIMATGLYECITTAMKDHPNCVAVQELGCGALWSLSVNQFNRVVLVRSGACERILRALDTHLNHEGFVQTALGALRTLSPEPEARMVISHMLGSQRVVRAMALHRSVVDIQRDGCAFLSNVAVDMHNQEVSVVSKEELQAVVRAMADHLKNESVVTSACFALKNYTYEERNLRNLSLFDDVVSLLEDAAQYATKASCRIDAAEVLKRIRLLWTEDTALEETVFSSLMQAMRRNSTEKNPTKQVEQSVATITDVIKEYYWSTKLICFGLETLLSLAGKSEAYMSRIMARKTLRAVVDTMTEHKPNPKVQQRGCELLKFLAEADPSNGPKICMEESCNAIVDALHLHRGDESVQIPAYAALKAMSKEPMCSEEILRSGGWQIIRDTEREGGSEGFDSTEFIVVSSSAFSHLPAASAP